MQIHWAVGLDRHSGIQTKNNILLNPVGFFMNYGETTLLHDSHHCITGIKYSIYNLNINDKTSVTCRYVVTRATIQHTKLFFLNMLRHSACA